MKEKNQPLLIVLTPILNEAWILSAFLKATSLWADYIIIVDQMSTDGSRDLYAKFCKENRELNVSGRECKLLVIDNPRTEMHQAATRRLLFDAAKKIEGDKILFALDADEFLSGNFIETKGWKSIINSTPGDVFLFYWMLLSPNGQSYRIQNKEPFYWAAHVDSSLLDGKFPDNFIDEWRLPWPSQVKNEIVITDINFLHFHDTNVVRQKNKTLFYQVLQYSQSMGEKVGISLNRRYNSKRFYQYIPLPHNVYLFYENHHLNLFEYLNLNDEGTHYIKSVIDNIRKLGEPFFRKLDIWDEMIIKKNHFNDPRRSVDKLIHWYLRKTNGITDRVIVRIIDKVLKYWY